jgi:hypothetical protein
MIYDSLVNAVANKGRVFMWIDYMNDYVQINKHELMKKTQSEGFGIISHLDCFRDKDCLYLKSK